MTKEKVSGISRRDLIKGASAGLAATSLTGVNLSGPGAAAAQQSSRSRGPVNSGHNILFVFTDQERHFSRWPRRLDLPGHERLERKGTYFGQHHIGATMCTSSRSIMMTGLQTAVNGMFENLDVPWVKDFSTDVPTIGHMLRKAGYYTSYKGKWHLTRAFDQEFPPERLFTREMEAYGFSDYVSPGDVVGHTLGGYSFDHIIAGSAISWLRRVGPPLSDEGKPWALTVGLVNPHDIMYFNTDAPGQRVQDTGRLLSHAASAPHNQSFAADWDMPIPASLTQPFDEPGGQYCGALTSHIDIAPSLLTIAGADRTQAAESAGRELPGKDFASLLHDPRGAAVNEVRDAALFTYSGLGSNDADLMAFIANAMAAGKDPKAELQATGFRPDLKKRGTVRSVFDGRYLFSRYFSPTEHHKPGSLGDLYTYNDLELYDRENDPGEMTNLAADRAGNGALVQALSDKLESIIATEIGIDDGRELPDVDGIEWALPQERFD